MTSFFHFRLALPVLFLLLCLGQPARSAAARPVLLEGLFQAVWGDAFTPSQPPVSRYFLATAAGRVELDLSAAAAVPPGPLLGLNGRRVMVEVEDAPASTRGLPDGPLPVRRIENIAVGEAAPRQAVPTNSPWVTIMCKFGDIAAEPENLAYFEQMYADTRPGLSHYWGEASYGRLDIDGSTAYGWYTLPRRRSYYLSGGSLNFDEISTDCSQQARAEVDFTAYEGINLVFNDDLDGFAWGGYGVAEGDYYRMTWLPPWGYRQIAVVAHEMGHGFGLPHSSGSYGRIYDNVWDLMSDVWAYCDRATDPTYGCLGQHTIGYHRALAGWLQADEIYTSTGTTETIFLERITTPDSGGYLLAKIPIGASTSRYYTAEVRQRIGYDVKLPAEAVVIHEVDEQRPNGRDAYVIDNDFNGNVGDAGAIWSVGETFRDPANGICISVTGQSGSGYLLTIGCGRQVAPHPVLVPLHLLLAD